MARKRFKPEEIVAKLRQVEVLQSRGMSLTTRSAVGLGVPGFRLISTPWWLR